MIREFSGVLKNRVVAASLPFIEVAAGAVKAVPMVVMDDAGMNKRTYTFPMSYDTNVAPCHEGESPMRDLVPNSTKKGILYFEEHGAQSTDRGPYGTQFTGNITAVVWYNKALITGLPYQHAQNTFVQMFLRAIGNAQNPQNEGGFTRVMINATRIRAQDGTIFSRYSYEETTRQYLMPPYEYFAIDFDFSFCTRLGCLPELPQGPAACRNFY